MLSVVAMNSASLSMEDKRVEIYSIVENVSLDRDLPSIDLIHANKQKKKNFGLTCSDAAGWVIH